MRDLVVGSGPAGIAIAHALLARGRQVTMIDAGLTMDPPAMALRSELAACDPDAWSPDAQAALDRLRQGDGGLLRPFGSDFPVRDPSGLFGAKEADWFDLRPSFARGGLSNGWGTAVMPYRPEDLTDWPAAARDLAADYAAIRQILPLAAEPDDLATHFPMLPIDAAGALAPSAQAQEILRRLSRRKAMLERSSIVFGRARQAVRADRCRLCANCLHGCPYGALFNASDALDDLIRRGIEYRPGLLATRFAQDQGSVQLHTHALAGADAVRLQGSRLFLAAGALSTTRVTLASLGEPNDTVRLLDSHQFLVPSLSRWWSPVDPALEPHHVLTEVFIELLDPALERSVHVQLYTYNSLYAQDMRRRFGPLARLVSPAIATLSRRTVVLQGFLHSDLSASVEIRFVDDGRAGWLQLRALASSRTKAAQAASLRRLRPALRAAGLVPLMPLANAGRIGSSFHAGGTFPMREQPSRLETDVLGRPGGAGRVHLVDSSVFPSIPATTITLPVMANAHRIGRQAPE